MSPSQTSILLLNQATGWRNHQTAPQNCMYLFGCLNQKRCFLYYLLALCFRYELMCACWQVCPDERPCVSNVCVRLEQLLSCDMDYLDLLTLDEGVTCGGGHQHQPTRAANHYVDSTMHGYSNPLQENTHLLTGAAAGDNVWSSCTEKMRTFILRWSLLP